LLSCKNERENLISFVFVYIINHIEDERRHCEYNIDPVDVQQVEKLGYIVEEDFLQSA
jgi:hypothetical protein